jgi:hypothetical protein
MRSLFYHSVRPRRKRGRAARTVALQGHRREIELMENTVQSWRHFITYPPAPRDRNLRSQKVVGQKIRLIRAILAEAVDPTPVPKP